MYRRWMESMLTAQDVMSSITPHLKSYKTFPPITSDSEVTALDDESRKVLKRHEEGEMRKDLMRLQSRNQQQKTLAEKLEERKQKRKQKVLKEKATLQANEQPLMVDDRSHNLSPENEELLHRVMRGDIEVSVTRQEKVVRIFTSSTFKDTFVERNILLKEVFPRLKDFCRQHYNYEFQVVDMRWGVRDKASNDHTTWKLCLQELRNCQRISASPCFVTFLSCRYGNRFLPSTIAVEEFQSLINVMPDDERLLVNKWYKLDENAVPAVYVLSKISEHFPNYLNNDDLSLKKKAQDAWWDLSDNLRKILARAASAAFTDTERIHQYYRSVTEAEIDAGILQAENPQVNCLWFKRNLTSLSENDFSKMACSYSDNASTKAERTEVRKLLHDLCERRIPKCLPSENIIQYDVPWDEQGINLDNPEHSAYIQKFAEDFEMKLKQKILEGIRMRELSTIQDPLYIEIVQHIRFSQGKIKRFKGREEILQAVDSYLIGNSQQPLVIHGGSGSGKTAVVAMAAKTACGLLKDKGIVILRFLGTTPECSNASGAVKSVCKQIRRSFPEIDFQKIEDIDTAMYEYLSLASAECPMILLLDSLDQISPDHNARLLKWLPKSLPPHVKLVVSTLPEEQYNCYQVLQATVEDQGNFVHVPLLNIQTADMIISSQLQFKNRKLSDKQMDVIRQIFSNVHTLSALYTKVCLDRVSLWKSYTPLSQCTLKHTVQEAIQAWFTTLEKLHGEIFVKRALGYITASKNGLTDAELEDILSCDDDVLNDVYQYWTPPLRRLPPLLWVRLYSSLSNNLMKHEADGRQVLTWFHRQFREIANKHFLSSYEERKLLHQNLADFFLGKWANVEKPYINSNGQQLSAPRHVPSKPLVYQKGAYNLRKLSELPYHLAKSGQLEVLKEEVLCNFNWLFTKLQARPLRKLQEDVILGLETFPEDQDIAIVSDIIQLSYDALRNYPHQLALQIIARVDSNVTEGHIGNLLMCAKDYKSDIPVLKPSSNFLSPPGGALRHFLSTNSVTTSSKSQYKRVDSGLAVYGIHISANSKYAVLGFVKALELWNIKYGYLLHNIDTSKNCETDLCQVGLYNTKNIIASSNGLILLYDFNTAELVTMVTIPSTHNSPCVFGEVSVNDQICLAVYNGEFINFYEMPSLSLVSSCNDSQLCSYDSPKEFATPVVKCSEQRLVCSMHDKHLFIIDTQDLSSVLKVDVFSGLDACIDSVFLTSDNCILVTKNASSEMEVYSLETGELVSQISFDLTSLYNEFSVSYDGKHLLATNDNVLIVFEILAQKEIAKIDHDKTVTMAASIDGRTVISMQSDFKLLIWDRLLLDSHHTSTHQHNENVSTTMNVPSQPHLLLVCTVNSADRGIQKLRLWESNNLVPVFEMILPLMSSIVPVNRQFAVMLHEEKLHGIDLVNKQVLHTMGDDITSVWADTIIFDGSPCVVVVRNGGCDLAVFDLKKGKTVQQIAAPEGTTIKHVEVSKDGQIAVFTLFKQIGLFVWSIVGNTTKLILEDITDTDGQYDMSLFTSCLTSDGRYLAMVTEKIVNLEHTGQPNKTFPGIIVWDLHKGHIIHKWHKKQYKSLNTQLVFTADDLLIISTGSVVEKMQNHLVYYHVWDVKKGILLVKKKGHIVMATSDTGSHVLLYCTQNGAVSLWDVTRDQCCGSIFVDKIDDVTNSKIIKCQGKVCVLLFRNGHVVSTLFPVAV